MLRSINSSDASGESVGELEEAISEMKSNPLFPKVVAFVWPITIFDRFLKREVGSDLQGLENLSLDTLSKGREFVLEHLMNNSTLKDKQLQAVLVAAVESGDGIADVIDGKLCERQAVVSCVSALETGLKILSKNIEVKELLEKEDKDTTLLGYVRF